MKNVFDEFVKKLSGDNSTEGLRVYTNVYAPDKLNGIFADGKYKEL